MSTKTATAKKGKLPKVRSAGLLIENNRGEILVLLRRDNRPEGNTWGLVGGKIDDGETKEEGIIREAREEIGLDINPDDVTFIKTFNWVIDNSNIEFELFRLKRNSNVEVILQDEEFKEYMWASPTGLYKRKDLMFGLYDILKKVYRTD